MIDLTSQAFASDPYPTFAMMRAEGGAHWDGRAWYFTRFVDVNRLLVSDVLASRGLPSWLSKLPSNESELLQPVEEFYSRWPVFSDRADHAVVRKALGASLGGTALRELLPELDRWTREVLCSFDASSGDLIEHLSRPLAMKCLDAVLGAPGDSGPLVELSRRVMAYLVTTGSDLDAAPAALEAINDLRVFVEEVLLPSGRGLIVQPLRELASCGAVDSLTILATVAQFLTGTIEPTVTALATALVQSAASLNVRRGLADGSLEASVVLEEALRFDSPFHFAPRRAAKSFEVTAGAVRPGDRVVLVLASANRDEDRWGRAETFDPFRAPQPHLAFGRGPHSCLGALMVRVQSTTLLTLASRTGLLDEMQPTLERVPSIGATTLRAI
jgi:cytochrome P450